MKQLLLMFWFFFYEKRDFSLNSVEREREKEKERKGGATGRGAHSAIPSWSSFEFVISWAISTSSSITIMFLVTVTAGTSASRPGSSSSVLKSVVPSWGIAIMTTAIAVRAASASVSVSIWSTRRRAIPTRATWSLFSSSRSCITKTSS